MAAAAAAQQAQCAPVEGKLPALVRNGRALIAARPLAPQKHHTRYFARRAYAAGTYPTHSEEPREPAREFK